MGLEVPPKISLHKVIRNQKNRYKNKEAWDSHKEILVRIIKFSKR